MAIHGRGFPLGTQFLFTPLGSDPNRVRGSSVFSMNSTGVVTVTGGPVPQFGRPSTDTVNEGWLEDDGSSASIFDQIDEVVPDDADFIKSPTAPTADVFVTKLTSVTDPLVSTGHIVRFRYGKSGVGGARIDILIELRQGYVNEASQGTLIATVLNQADVGTYPLAGTYILQPTEADLITDYSNLYLRYKATQV